MDLDTLLPRLGREPALNVDLAEAALALARDEYADLETGAYLAKLDQLAARLRDQLTGRLRDDTTLLCELLFAIEGFQGDDDHFYDADNSYLNRVFDRRCGLPITLSIIAIAVGRRAGLQVDGVGLPGHYIARAVSGREVVLFDPFHGGDVLTIDDCERLVTRATGQDYEATPDDLSPTPAGPTLRRMLTNLKGVYLRDGDWPRAVRTIGRIMQLEPDNVTERRDFGVCLARAGRPGPAIDHLTAYLHAEPATADAELVRQLLRQSRAEVARWN